MIKQKLIKRSEVPPGDFTFVCPDTGYVVSERNLQEMFSKIEQHYNANKIELIEDWKEIVECRICEKLPPGWCNYEDENIPNYCHVTGNDIIRGVESLANLVWTKFLGKPIYVTDKEAERRAEICAKCHLNVETRVCLGCGAMAGVMHTVGRIKGNRKTRWDSMLRNCCICGCRCDAIVHIEREILIAGDDEQSLKRYPEWCWKRVDAKIIKNTISKSYGNKPRR